ncbi:MAG: YodL domain-containing protein [Clostridiales bacterium]|nr:YodL domain-containing protein [Clostridiales bacterium]
MENKFSIYQLKNSEKTKGLQFMPYDKLTSMGKDVDFANYEHIHTDILTDDTSLEDIYIRFNINHPKNYKGHSLSVSDVVVFNMNGTKIRYYVEVIGFKKLFKFQ